MSSCLNNSQIIATISALNKILQSFLFHPQLWNVWYCENISLWSPINASNYSEICEPHEISIWKTYLSMQRGKLIQHPSTVVPSAHWGRCQAIVWLCDWVRDHGIWYLAPWCLPPRSRFYWACTSWWCKEVAMRWQQAVMCCVIRPFVGICAAPEPRLRIFIFLFIHFWQTGPIIPV